MLCKRLKSIAKLNPGKCCFGRIMLLAALFSVAGQAYAMTYVLPAKGDVIGQVQYASAKSTDTLKKLARLYDVGISQIKAANPDIVSNKLKAGQRVVIPSRHILPKGPREGIVINIAEQRLYYYSRPEEGPALVSTYPISVGPEGKSRLGNYKVEKRLRKPSWNVPISLRAANSRLPEVMPPGPKNPLGEYGMSLDGGGYMIHGTNEPYSIGTKVSRGSIRLYPEDIAVLVRRTEKGVPVRIVNESFKYGYKNGALYFEIHKPPGVKGDINLAALVNLVTKIIPDQLWADGWQKIRMTGEQASGIATPISMVRGKTKYPKRWRLRLATYKSYTTARKFMLQLEELGVPVSVEGCERGKCVMYAGPFTDYTYMKNLAKRMKWITRVKSVIVPYNPKDNIKTELGNKLALTQ